MALAIADRVKETTTSTGTGTINLAGAATGFQTFVAGIGDGNTCYYAIEDANGSAWEVGIGTVTDASPDTLARTTVLKSTNSNNALTLTSGTHTVFATYPSDKAVFKDESGIVLASGIQVGASGLLLDSVTITTLQIHSESFVDNDTSLMTSKAIADKIEDYGYTTNTGDITAVVAGSGISGGANDGSATVTLDLNGLASGVIANDDYLVFVDADGTGKKDNLPDIATLFAGTNLTATNSVIAVDDAFLVNDDNDTTTGTITAGGFTTTGTWTMDTSAGGTAGITNINVTDTFTDDDVTLMSAGAIKEKIEGYNYITNTTTGLITASGVKVQRDSASGVIINSQIAFGDYTFMLPSGNGTDGQVLTTDSKNTYWSTAGVTIANDAANKLITADGDGTFTAEANLTYDGSAFTVNRDMTVGATGGDAGFDVKFYGFTDGKYLHWDESEDELGLIGAAKLVFNATSGGDNIYASSAGHLQINAATTLDITAPNVDINVNGQAAGGGKLNVDGLIESSGVTVGTSGVVMKDADLSHSITVKAPEVVSTSFTFLLPSGDGSNGQVLTTDSKNTYWSTSSGGVSGDTFATDLKIGRDAHNLIDFATTDDKIIFRVNNDDDDGLALVANVLSPFASDGAALGTGSLMWSDLFLASAGVINFNNGDVTLTHSSNNLTIAGGTLTTAGIIRGITTKVDTDDYTPTASDHIILVDTTNGDRDINLPAAADTNIGQEYTVKKIDSGTGKVYIKPSTTGGYGPDDIDEYDTKYVLYLQHDTVTFVCGPGDDTAGDEQWWVIAEKVTPHCARLQQESAQSISNSTSTVVDWTDTLFALGCTPDLTNNKIVITRPGKYLCGGFCRMSNMTSSSSYIFLTINRYDLSTTTNTEHGGVNKNPVSNRPAETTQVLLDCESGDEITLKMWQNGGTKNTVSAGNNTFAYLWVQEVK